MTDYSRTRYGLANILAYLQTQLATQSTWSTRVVACEQDLDKVFRILDTVQPPGVLLITDECAAGPVDQMDRMGVATLVPFTRKLTTITANVSALQTMEEAILTLFDFQIDHNVLYKFRDSKGFPLDRWSGVVATKLRLSIEDN